MDIISATFENIWATFLLQHMVTLLQVKNLTVVIETAAALAQGNLYDSLSMDENRLGRKGSS